MGNSCLINTSSSFLTFDEKLYYLKPETLGRLLFLSTFVGDEDGKLYKNGEIITNNDQLSCILNIRKTTIKEFCKECAKYNILSSSAWGIRICDLVSCHAEKSARIILYKYPLYLLFKNILPRQHKYVGYILYIIDNIDINTGVVYNEGFPASLTDLHTQLLQYKSKNATDFKKNLEQLWIVWNGCKEYLFEITPFRNKKVIRVNPLFIKVIK